MSLLLGYFTDSYSNITLASNTLASNASVLIKGDLSNTINNSISSTAKILLTIDALNSILTTASINSSSPVSSDLNISLTQLILTSNILASIKCDASNNTNIFNNVIVITSNMIEVLSNISVYLSSTVRLGISSEFITTVLQQSLQGILSTNIVINTNNSISNTGSSTLSISNLINTVLSSISSILLNSNTSAIDTCNIDILTAISLDISAIVTLQKILEELCYIQFILEEIIYEEAGLEIIVESILPEDIYCLNISDEAFITEEESQILFI